MTVPMWTPFAVLAVVCGLFPPPTWMRRIDWVLVVGWCVSLSVCLLVWYGVFRLVWWAV